MAMLAVNAFCLVKVVPMTQGTLSSNPACTSLNMRGLVLQTLPRSCVGYFGLFLACEGPFWGER